MGCYASTFCLSDLATGGMQMTIGNLSNTGSPAIHVIHENAEWTAPLLTALEAGGAAWVDWHMGDFALDTSLQPPAGVFYNRMSASSHTRGHRYAPEMTAGLLHWLEAAGAHVLNGSRAINLEVSKIAQYAALSRAGLSAPTTIACHTAEQIMSAYDKFDGRPVITKHNRAGKGLGVKLFRDAAALGDYVHGETFDPSVDGITLLQSYIEAPAPFITRVEFIGRQFLYAVRVDTSDGFELCPADVCALDANICMADSNTTDIQPHKFDIIGDFATSSLGEFLLPRMEKVMHQAGLDVAAFEFICDADGTPYVYDVNTNTNYNSDAEERAGVSAMGALASYLRAELDWSVRTAA